MAARQVHVLWCGCNGVPSSVYRPLLARLQQPQRLSLSGGAISVASTSFASPHLHFSGDGAGWGAALSHVADAAERARDVSGLPVVGIGHSLGGALIYGAAGRTASAQSILCCAI